MSPIALILNLLLGGLLLAALALGVRLDRRLRALRDSQAGFIKAVSDLDSAALRTQAGLAQWREAADEARELLHDRIEKAKVQVSKLDKLLAAAAKVPEREAPVFVPRETVLDLTRRDALRAEPAPAEAPRTDPPRDERARAEAIRAEALTREILSREPVRSTTLRTLRPDPARPELAGFEPTRFEPPRSSVSIDDDLFEASPREARQAGGRRL